MCLIAFALNPTSQLRLLVVANRDEFHARPSAPLAYWADHPHILAGRDIEAKGTWLGVSTRGRLVAVTNVRLPEFPPPGLRSRGALAFNFLASSSSPQAYLDTDQGNVGAHGPCNLLMVDGQQAVYASNQSGVQRRLLPAGVYGLSNAALDTPWPKTVQLKAAVTDWLAQGRSSDLTPLFAALANPAKPPDALLPDTGVGLERERFVAPAFIHGHEYGTRCSTVVMVGADGAGSVTERRFGPEGVALGETHIQFQWPS